MEEERRSRFDPGATVEQRSVAAWPRSVHPTASSVVAAEEREHRSTRTIGVAAVAAVDRHVHTSRHQPTAAVRETLVGEVLEVGRVHEAEEMASS